MRLAAVTLGVAVLLAAGPAAQRKSSAPAGNARLKLATDFTCVSDVGQGIKTRREFCDVLVGSEPGDSVSMSIPPHVGTAAIAFDLHDRFTVPVLSVSGPLVYAQHEATVSLVRPGGIVFGHAAVIREFRSVADLFDQISGGNRPGGVKAAAPGPPEAVQLTVPAGVSLVGIVGIRLKVTSRTGEETFDAPGRPVAMVSNLRVQYQPSR